jgi:hypothetical protein
MSTPKKSTKSVKPEVVENFIPLFTKNVERLAELQKKSLEVAAEQSAEFVATCKEAFETTPETPGMFVFDLLGQAFDRTVEAQKTVIDQTVEQSNAFAELMKERTGSAKKVAEGMTAAFQQTIEQSVAAQKKAIDYFAQQQKAAYETAKKQFQFTNPAAEAFQAGMDVLIETQKTMIDIATKPLKRSAVA